MAAMADRDVSETRTAIRGIAAVQNALRETQLEQGRTLEQHTQVLAQHSQVLAQHSQSLKSLAEVSGVLLAGQQHHGEILASLVADMGSLKTSVGSLEATVNSVTATVGRHDELFAEILDRLPPKPEN